MGNEEIDIFIADISFLAAFNSIFSVGFLVLWLKNKTVGLFAQFDLECYSKLVLGKWAKILLIPSPTNFLT